MSKIDVNVPKLAELAEEVNQLMTNLANTATVFEEIVKPQADVSGSEKLQAVARDVASIKEDFEAKAKSASAILAGAEDYLTKLKQINSL